MHRDDHRILPDRIEPRFEPTLRRARGALDSLATELPQLGRNVPAPVHDPGTAPNWGIIKHHPMLALLAEIPYFAATPEHTWIRSAAAVVTLAVREADDLRYQAANHSISAAARSLRQLLRRTEFRATRDLWPAAGTDHAENEGAEPQACNPAADWQEHLSAWAAAHEADPRYEDVRNIERALAFLTERRDPRPGRVRGTQRVPKADVPDRPADPPPSVPIPPPVKVSAPPPPPDRPTTHGGTTGTGTGGGPNAGAQSTGSGGGGDPPPSHGRDMLYGRQAAAIRSAAQGLPGIDQHAVQAEVLRGAFDGGGTRAALTALAAYCGERRLDAICVAHRFCDLDPDPQDTWVVIQPFALVIPNRVSEILPSPPDGRDVPTAARAITVPLDPRMPGARALRARAGRHLHACQGKPRSPAARHATTVPLFTQDDIRTVTRELRQLDAPRRITLPWMADQQRRTSERVLGGTITHALTSRARDELVYRTPAHYWQISAQDAGAQRWLANQHARAWLQDEPVPELTVTGAPRVAEESPQLADGVLGSRRVPDLADVRGWVATMAARIDRLPIGRPSREVVVAFHNDYVVYALQVLLWSTGARMARAALVQLSARDGRGHVILRDKGVQGGARVALLAPMARAQMAMLQTSMQWLVRYADWESQPHGVVLVDDQLRPRPLEPRLIHKLSRSPLVDNAHRHALTQVLRSEGVRDDRIALILGHSHPGADPGDPWSMMSPAPTADEIAIVQTHLEKCGFTARRGFRGRTR